MLRPMTRQGALRDAPSSLVGGAHSVSLTYCMYVKVMTIAGVRVVFRQIGNPARTPDAHPSDRQSHVAWGSEGGVIVQVISQRSSPWCARAYEVVLCLLRRRATPPGAPLPPARDPRARFRGTVVPALVQDYSPGFLAACAHVGGICISATRHAGPPPSISWQAWGCGMGCTA